MMPRRTGFLALLAATLLVSPFLGAQDTGDNSLDLDSLFGEVAGEEGDSVEVSEEYVDPFLQPEALSWGGSWNFNFGVGAAWDKPLEELDLDYLFNKGTEQPSLSLGANLFFSARPQADQRYYGKFIIDYPFESKVPTFSDLTAATDGNPFTNPGAGVSVPSIKIWELYTDFTWDDRVFFRAGKQMATWGVGYFFQPGDIISMSSVDPQDPEAEREGPIMVKASMPFGTTGLEAFVVAPEGLSSAKELAYALRGTTTVAGFELGLGARYQTILDGKLGSAFQTVLTANGSLGPVTVFAEGVAKYGTSRRFLVEDATAFPLGWKVEERLEDWFLSATAGFNWNPTDTYLSFAGQYYYNGEGYSVDAGDLVAPGFASLAAGTLSAQDLQNLGFHYGAGNIRYSFTEGSKVSVGLFWIGNLGDGSGLVRPSVSLKILDELSIGANAQVKYGDESSEYGANSFLQDVSAGLTLSIGSGKF